MTNLIKIILGILLLTIFTNKAEAQTADGKENTMQLTEKAKAYRDKAFAREKSKLEETDPEFFGIINNFAFDEVLSDDTIIDDRTNSMAILATLIGCGGIDEFREMLPAALNFGVTPIETKEIIYQATAYLGIGRVLPFLNAANEILISRGVKLPLKAQGTTTRDTRLAAGAQAQVDIFGPGMKEFYKSGPAETRHINRRLADNCFGDYYTRGGLDLRLREMITFCFIAAQGGCEPQLTAHAAGNIRIGNDKAFLIAIASRCLPYIGYPRTLNAIRCINEAVK